MLYMNCSACERAFNNPNAVQTLAAQDSSHAPTDIETASKYDVTYEVERLVWTLGHQADYFKKLKDLEDATGASVQLEMAVTDKSGGESIQVRLFVSVSQHVQASSERSVQDGTVHLSTCDSRPVRTLTASKSPCGWTYTISFAPELAVYCR